MGDHSGIVWTDATWGPVTGCTRVSEGCAHCYIERTPPFRMTGRRFDGLGIGASTGVQLHPSRLDQPLHWRRPRMIFVNSMADLFHADVPDEFIARVFAVMGLAWQHNFQVLTKRPARMRSLLADPAFEDAVFDAAMDGSLSGRAAEQGRGYWAVDHGRSVMMPLSNVWLGVSVENQRWAEQRIPLLRATPAAVRFLSCEPLLDEVDLTPHLLGATGLAPGIDWVIAGGESGPGARPMSPRWVRQLRDQCTAADVAFTFKQWGEWTDVDHGLDAAGEDAPLFRRCTGNNRVNGHRMRTVDGQLLVRLGRHKTGRVLDGRTWGQFPARGTQHEPAGGTPVPTPEHDVDRDVDRQLFDVDGAQISAANSDAQRVLAEAHTHRVRPSCLCVDGGVPMYIARVGDRFIVKRMPDTGMVHAAACPSYLPPEALSGLGQVLGGAIIEQADTGVTALRLGFRMAKADRNGPAPASSGEGGSDSVTADGTRLGMRSVLHYLWQEADLATWSPAMAGKRNWRIVSWYLRQAARGKFTRGKPLAGRLFIPEPFSADHKADLAARRMSAWAPARAKGRSSQFMILIGEVKTIEPARFGHKLVVKHLPDAPLMLDEDLHRRMLKRFADELELWQADEAGHLMVIATFTVGRTGLASVQELSLAMTDEHWLPYESAADKLLLDTAIGAHRRFTKSLRYNLTADAPMASLVFTDTETPTAAYLLSDADERDDIEALQATTGTDTWTWVVGETMPALPTPKRSVTATAQYGTST